MLHNVLHLNYMLATKPSYYTDYQLSKSKTVLAKFVFANAVTAILTEFASKC